MLVSWRPSDVTIESFRDTLLGEPTKAALACGPESLVLNVVDGPRSPISRVRVDRSRIGALVSMRVASRSAADRVRAAFDPSGRASALYRVQEAIPLDYERTWKPGEPSPGLKQVTFFSRRKGMTYEEFVSYWRGTHTPLALEVHPLFRYVRNVVTDPLTEGAPSYEGIVELSFRTLEDVTDTQRFYGGKPENVQRIATDVRNFIDFDTIDIAHMREIVLVP